MTFEAAVQQLVGSRFSRSAAEAQVRAQLPHLAPPPAPAKDEAVLEKAEQIEIRKLATAYGFNVWVLSQPRATKQTPGLADLWLTHRSAAIALWWETKRQVGGELSPPQVDFRDACLRTNTGYGTGDRYTFVEKLIALDLAVRGAGQYGIEPIRSAAAR